jgi:outer membrane receptor protein involved in Fe transport
MRSATGKNTVPLNLMVSIFTLTFALIVRSRTISVGASVPYLNEMFGFTAGGVVSVFYGASSLARSKASKIKDAYLGGLVLFFEVKNVFDRTYVASANNITDSISVVTGAQNPGSVLVATGTGSIYGGAPKSFLGGLKLAFR